MQHTVGLLSKLAWVVPGVVVLAILVLLSACSGATETSTTNTASTDNPAETVPPESTQAATVVVATATAEIAQPTVAATEIGEGSPDRYDPMDPNVGLTLPNDITQDQMDDWMAYHDTALTTKEQCYSVFEEEVTQLGAGEEAFDVFPFELPEGATLWIHCEMPGYLVNARISDPDRHAIFEAGMTFDEFQDLPEGSVPCSISYNPTREQRGFRVLPIEILQVDGDVISYISMGQERQFNAPSMGLKRADFFGPVRSTWSPYTFVIPDCSLA